jgi:hypothetical protein
VEVVMMKVSISLSVGEQQTLDEVLRAVPYANPHALAKLAVRLGLDALRRDPKQVPALLSGQRMRFMAVGDPPREWRSVASQIGIEELADAVGEEVSAVNGGGK